MPYAEPHTNVAIPTALLDELHDKICKDWELPKSSAIRKAIREFIEKYQEKEEK